jgi:hypothetical protein
VAGRIAMPPPQTVFDADASKVDAAAVARFGVELSKPNSPAANPAPIR